MRNWMKIKSSYPIVLLTFLLVMFLFQWIISFQEISMILLLLIFQLLSKGLCKTQEISIICYRFKPFLRKVSLGFYLISFRSLFSGEHLSISIQDVCMLIHRMTDSCRFKDTQEAKLPLKARPVLILDQNFPYSNLCLLLLILPLWWTFGLIDSGVISL